MPWTVRFIGRVRYTSPMNHANGRLEIDTQLASLRAAHRALDERIKQLFAEEYHDQVHMQRLKKQKLQLKDRIVRLEESRLPDIIA